jgi:hypothetical protein
MATRTSKKDLNTLLRKALGFDLPIEGTSTHFKWNGVITLKVVEGNRIAFERVSKDTEKELRAKPTKKQIEAAAEAGEVAKGDLPNGYFDADTADELLTTMLVYALDNDNYQLSRDVYLPDVCDGLSWDVKELNTAKVKAALKSYMTGQADDKVEAFLKSSYSPKTGRSWPTLVVRKHGSKPTGSGTGKKNETALAGLSIPA